MWTYLSLFTIPPEKYEKSLLKALRFEVTFSRSVPRDFKRRQHVGCSIDRVYNWYCRCQKKRGRVREKRRDENRPNKIPHFTKPIRKSAAATTGPKQDPLTQACSNYDL